MRSVNEEASGALVSGETEGGPGVFGLKTDFPEAMRVRAAPVLLALGGTVLAALLIPKLVRRARLSRLQLVRD